MTSELRQRVFATVVWIIAAILFSAAGYVVILSKALRPVADDYRIAVAVHEHGVLGAVAYFWSTWVGDAFAWTLNVLLVGAPLAHLPLNLSSAVPFVVGTLAVTTAGVVLVGHCRDLAPTRLVTMAPLALSLPVLWWAYFWTRPSFSDPAELSSSLASAIAMWPTINAQYVVPIALLVTAWFLLSRLEGLPTTVLLSLFAVLGVLVGLTGAVTAVTLITFIPLLALGRFLTATMPKRPVLLRWMAAVTGALLGAIASHWSPGSTQRMTLLNQPSLSADFFHALLRSMPRAISEWGSGVWDPGAAVVLVVTCTLGLLAALRGFRVNNQKLAATGVALGAMSVIASIWNRVSEAFSYEAFWHLLQVREITWLALVALGFSLGATFAEMMRPVWLTPITLFVGAIGVVIALAAVATMTNTILVRYDEWGQGPAPFAGIGDIETDWVNEAWQELATHRSLPDRSG